MPELCVKIVMLQIQTNIRKNTLLLKLKPKPELLNQT
jgi:hypothetical protein